MYLRHEPTGDLVEIIDLPDLINPSCTTARGRSYTGEVICRPENFLKSELAFPSGEPLPLCWADAHYNEHRAA